MKSFSPGFITDSSDQWDGYGLRFPTREEAERRGPRAALDFGVRLARCRERGYPDGRVACRRARPAIPHGIQEPRVKGRVLASCARRG